MTKSIVKTNSNLNSDRNIFGYQNSQSNKVGFRVSQSVKPSPLACKELKRDRPKRISKRGVLKFYYIGPDNNIEFLKHFMNILLKNLSTET